MQIDIIKAHTVPEYFFHRKENTNLKTTWPNYQKLPIREVVPKTKDPGNLDSNVTLVKSLKILKT